MAARHRSAFDKTVHVLLGQSQRSGRRVANVVAAVHHRPLVDPVASEVGGPTLRRDEDIEDLVQLPSRLLGEQLRDPAGHPFSARYSGGPKRSRASGESSMDSDGAGCQVSSFPGEYM